jgi:multisubunit Na+/H+ antiporter MnhB subunit
MVLAGRGVVPWRAAHWADRACAAGAVVACVACVLVLTLGRADARFVGDRRRARRVIAGVLLALLALALLAMLTVEDEGPG